MLPFWLYVTIYWVLQGLWWAFLIRFIFEVVNPRGMTFKISGALLWIIESLFTVTDWLLKPIRKVVKPIRIGALAIDLSWTIALVLVSFLQVYLGTLGFVA
jgi:YggT family protein